jgi:hypothetical protein
MIHVSAIGFMLISLACGFGGWRQWRAGGAGFGDPVEEATVADRARFMGGMGAVIGLFSALLIAGQWLAIAFIDPCMRV